MEEAFRAFHAEVIIPQELAAASQKPDGGFTFALLTPLGGK
jgi:hypothetical protein